MSILSAFLVALQQSVAFGVETLGEIDGWALLLR